MSIVQFNKAMDCWNPEVLRLQKLGFKKVIILLNTSHSTFAAKSSERTNIYVCIHPHCHTHHIHIRFQIKITIKHAL